MTTKPMNNIAIFARRETPEIIEIVKRLHSFLVEHKHNVLIDPETAALTKSLTSTTSTDKLGETADIMIVVGGDGSMLKAARLATEQSIPVLGINRGRLGFLADINPQAMESILDVLSGKYKIEERFLLHATIYDGNKILGEQIALNDSVLLPQESGHTFGFSVKMNSQFIAHYSADGMIVATPTGSTAYALSAGGPIIYPGINAFILVPMFAHSLSTRPLVLSNNEPINLIIDEHEINGACISCDGEPKIAVPSGGHVSIKKYKQTLKLIHPLNYDYFTTLREKLGWE